MEQAKHDGSKKKTTVNVPADLWNYGKRELLDGQLVIETSAATFVDKGEDRHCVLYGSKQMCDCQSDCREVPQMVAYLAVFDGHDGPRAADYAWKGLLPHVLSETQESIRTGQAIVVDGCRVDSSLDAGIINAFHHAEKRFAMKMDPPTFDNVKQGVKSTRHDNKGRLSRAWKARPSRKPPRGGTTALTLQIYSESDSSGKMERCRPMQYAVITNLGDCRLLTDKGTGSHEFHQVTTDHRPGEAGEKARLDKFVQQGDAVVGRIATTGAALRVYPGGLAVSRSLGDLDSSPAIICTPDIFRVPISEEKRTHRFVLGCDGLWDVLSNTEVGKIVARLQQNNLIAAADESSANDANDENNIEKKNMAATMGSSAAKETEVSPNEAAARLMELCLRKGGYMDDVTILVVDITYNGSELGSNAS